MPRRIFQLGLILAVLTENAAIGQQATTTKPAASRIVFVHQQPGQIRDRRISAVKIGDRSIHTLTDELPYRYEPDQSLVVSPDGKQVAYLADATYPPEGGLVTFTVFIRSMQDRKSNGTNLGVKAHGIHVWSPDGKKLLINVIDDRFSHTQYLLDLQAKKMTKLALPKPNPPRKATYVSEPYVSDWSPDGKWFIATCSFGKGKDAMQYGLFLYKSDGSEMRHLDHIVSGVAGRFSPDGQRILFDGKYETDGKRLDQKFVADLRGGKPIRVTRELDGAFWGACWSPDGKRIAYLWHNKGDEQGETFLMAVDADGENAEVLASQKDRISAQLHSLNWR